MTETFDPFLARMLPSSEQRAARDAAERLRDTLAAHEMFAFAKERFPAAKPPDTGPWQAQRAAQARAAQQQQKALQDEVAREMAEWGRRSGYLAHELKAKTDKLLNTAASQYGFQHRPVEMALTARHLEILQDATRSRALAREVRRLRAQREQESARAQQERADLETISGTLSDDARADAALRIIDKKPRLSRTKLQDGDPRLESVQRRLERQQGIE